MTDLDNKIKNVSINRNFDEMSVSEILSLVLIDIREIIEKEFKKLLWNFDHNL